MSFFKHLVFYAKNSPLKYNYFSIRLNSTTPANNNESLSLNDRSTQSNKEYPLHTPVMLKEVLESLVDHSSCADGFKVYSL